MQSPHTPYMQYSSVCVCMRTVCVYERMRTECVCVCVLQRTASTAPGLTYNARRACPHYNHECYYKYVLKIMLKISEY